MALIYDGTLGLTYPDNSIQNTAATGFGFKNRIINGAMVIDQRNAGATTTPTVDAYTIDRWQSAIGGASGWITFQQNSGNAPTTQGFTQCLKMLSTGANTPASGTISVLQQRIEGYNIADFALGTASPKTFTFSCWAYASVAGTYSVVFANNDITRAYGSTYTLTANTWTYVTATIPGDTSGTWQTGTSIGMRVIFSLGTGSSNSISAGSWQTVSGNAYNVTGTTQLSATNGATLYITGVQLEKGSTATSFDYRPYGYELLLSQRYAYVFSGTTAGDRIGSGFIFSATGAIITLPLPVTMRVAPVISGTPSPITLNDSLQAYNTTSVTLNSSSVSFAALSAVSTGMNVGRGCQVYFTNTQANTLILSAEL
jgi:hypothetical protein